MGQFIIEHLWEILFGLISAGLLAFCKYLWNTKKEYEKTLKENENRKYRQMILDEIEPIIEEIHRVQGSVEAKINDLANSTDKRIKDLEIEHATDKEALAKDMELVDKKLLKNLDLIIGSYKFRLIQLCKTHLKDGYITQSDFDQISEFYKLYTGLGGNGQAQEYYERVLDLPLRND